MATKVMTAKEIAALTPQVKAKPTDGRVPVSGNCVVAFDPEAQTLTIVVSTNPERVAVEYDDVKHNLWFTKGGGWDASQQGIPFKVGLNVYRKA